MSSEKPNTEQQKVIDTTEVPLLVIAGPGAGKTKTLVDRVIHLIKDKKVDASNIMVATFTEKAAKELVSRISTKAQELEIDVNLSDMYIGTLHSIFLNILEEYRLHTKLKRNYRVMETFEQEYFVYRNIYHFKKIEGIETLFITQKDKKEFEQGKLAQEQLISNAKKRINGWTAANKICTLVNKVAEENLDLKKLAKCKNDELQALAKLTEEYRSLLDEQNALDFSLIQTHTWNLLQKLSIEKKDISDWKELADSIMIDWNYDGVTFSPTTTDIPEKNELVKGTYKVPQGAGTIHIKITDLISESWEGNVQ